MSNDNNLKNFISKLNDRNLQRKRESGITTYVLISFLIFCIYKLYKNVTYYIFNLSIVDISSMVHIICLTSNSLIAMIMILESFTIEKRPFSNLKVIKYDGDSFYFFEFVISLIVFIIPISSLITSFLYNNDQISIYYYAFLGVLNVVLFLFMISPLISSKKKLRVYNDHQSSNTGARMMLFFTSLIVICFSITQIYKIALFEKFIFIKIILITYLILYLLMKIVEQEKNDINTFNLENFEYEIYIKNLDDSEIRAKLEENFVGYLVENWIERNKSEVKNFKTEIKLLVAEALEKIKQLEIEVDKKSYPIEYEGRKNVITENTRNFLLMKIPIFENILIELKKILSDTGNLTDSEISDLHKLQGEISEIVIRYTTKKR